MTEVDLVNLPGVKQSRTLHAEIPSPPRKKASIASAPRVQNPETPPRIPVENVQPAVPETKPSPDRNQIEPSTDASVLPDPATIPIRSAEKAFDPVSPRPNTPPLKDQLEAEKVASAELTKKITETAATTQLPAELLVEKAGGPAPGAVLGSVAPVAEIKAPAITTALPRYSENPEPRYPDIALRKGWEGLVVLRVEVKHDGLVRDVTVAASSGFTVLDQAAVRAVSRWTFVPAMLSGLPVDGRAMIPISFVLP